MLWCQSDNVSYSVWCSKTTTSDNAITEKYFVCNVAADNSLNITSLLPSVYRLKTTKQIFNQADNIYT